MKKDKDCGDRGQRFRAVFLVSANIASFVKIENPNEIIIELEYQLFFEWNRSPEHEFFNFDPETLTIMIASLEYSVFIWGAQFGEDKQHTIYNSNLNVYVFAGFDLQKQKYGFEIGGSVGSLGYENKYFRITVDFLTAKAYASYKDGKLKYDVGFGWVDIGVTLDIKEIIKSIFGKE